VLGWMKAHKAIYLSVGEGEKLGTCEILEGGCVCNLIFNLKKWQSHFLSSYMF
jgi:hypothetical protein